MSKNTSAKNKNQLVVESDEEADNYFESDPKGQDINLMVPGASNFKKVEIVFDEDTTVNFLKTDLIKSHYRTDSFGTAVDPNVYQLTLGLATGNVVLNDYDLIMRDHLDNFTNCQRVFIQFRGIRQPPPQVTTASLGVKQKH